MRSCAETQRAYVRLKCADRARKSDTTRRGFPRVAPFSPPCDLSPSKDIRKIPFRIVRVDPVDRLRLPLSLRYISGSLLCLVDLIFGHLLT